MSTATVLAASYAQRTTDRDMVTKRSALQILAAIHDANIHRDIKPENVVITNGMSPIADLEAYRAKLTRTSYRLNNNEIIGTLVMSSPNYR